MKSNIFLLFSLTILIALASCTGNGNRISVLPTATGSPFEVIVVMEDKLWRAEAGVTLKALLTSDVPGLPQSEQQFRVTSVTPNHFDKILKPVRNILIVEIDATLYTQTKLTFANNVWAQGQSVLYLKAPDAASLDQYMLTNRQLIIDFFVNSELNRIIRVLRDTYNRDASDQLLTLLGVEMNIPTDLLQINKKENFFWISNNQRQSRMDIVVYAVPYTEADAFTLPKMMARRDSIMKLNIPGAFEGTYMATQKFLDPTYRAMSINNKFVGELRGLWEIHGDIMGGPFVSHSLVDEANHRIITVEAFIYAPEKEKRNLIRKMEAALYTLRLPQEHQLPEVPVLPNN